MDIICRKTKMKPSTVSPLGTDGKAREDAHTSGREGRRHTTFHLIIIIKLLIPVYSKRSGDDSIVSGP